ncbi:UNVERIFIED_ORG: hypothetical protein ABIC62_006590 [Burkholderia sp. 1595]|uniref:Transposase n=1 Tax=Paraburkholderia terricola TaxID=169427 RepID=A0ABU1M284_9BURK|nr:hypothetical protein [Paraburkholderia terricola]MDR6485451.1 hypothetical protein [Paraburkholderia terricola]
MSCLRVSCSAHTMLWLHREHFGHGLRQVPERTQMMLLVLFRQALSALRQRQCQQTMRRAAS